MKYLLLAVALCFTTAQAQQGWELVNQAPTADGVVYRVLIPESRQRDLAYYRQIGDAVCAAHDACVVTFWNDREFIPADRPAGNYFAQTATYERKPGAASPTVSPSCALYPDSAAGAAAKCQHLPGVRPPWPVTAQCPPEPENPGFEKRRCYDWPFWIQEMRRSDCEANAQMGTLLSTCKPLQRMGNYWWMKAVKRCLDLGVDPNPDCSITDADAVRMFSSALDAGDVQIVDWFLNRGMRPRFDAVWQTLATCNRRRLDGGRVKPETCAKMVDRLLASKFDVNERDSRGWTPVAIMAASGNEPMTELLLRRGADPNAGGTRCESPLDFAWSRDKDSKTAPILEKHGALPRDPITKGLCKLDEMRSISH